MLDKQGIPHTVLNAKQHAREAAIVAQAGRLARDHGGHQHGRPRRRHPARRQPRGAGRARRCVGAGPRPRRPRTAEARYARAADEVQGRECRAEGDKVRELGGLYVLGSERHESRRIDNQLRGRSGRQGDPGESPVLPLARGRADASVRDRRHELGDGSRPCPTTCRSRRRMVTKAIERAQNTVEAEQRRDPQGRPQVRRGDERAAQGDLRPAHADHRRRRPARAHPRAARRRARQRRRRLPVRASFTEDWDLERLVVEANSTTRREFTAEDLAQAATPEQIVEACSPRPSSTTRSASETLAGRRRAAADAPPRAARSCSQIIDQRWREHLCRDGLPPRGHQPARPWPRQDPFVAWQREGFEMFGQLMSGIDDDYVRYVIHVQVQVLEQAAERRAPTYTRATSTPPPTTPRPGSPRRPSSGPWPARPTARRAPRSSSARRRRQPAGPGRPMAAPDARRCSPCTAPDPARVGRNDPCWCGSGSKFKLCHGAN